MRRYLYSGAFDALPIQNFDVVIVGSGIAGLYGALHIDPALRVALVTKENLKRSNSYFAQGGIAAVLSPTDNFESHIEDTLTAGAGLCNEEAVRVLVEEGPENIQELIDLNVPFDTNPEGELQITREGGHSCRRIIHCGGDATGRETTKQLGHIVQDKENITIFYNTYLIDLLTADGSAAGCIVSGEDEKPFILHAPNVILATGGVGYLYQYTTNPRGAVGDGMACAHRAGVVCENMEMIQFHPTTLISPKHSDRLFLISEAVRGEGGILRNHQGEAFMGDKHKLKDLAPRDIVTRCILQELDRTGEKNVFLDVSSMTEEFFSARFPTIYEECHKFGIMVPRDQIPVRPAQHYIMGGVKTNLDAMTSMEGLYACGEVASTGIHGANRLASNSMLECLVFARRAARHINGSNRKMKELSLLDSMHLTKEITSKEIAQDRALVRETLTKYAGVVRHSKELQAGAQIIGELLEKYRSLRLDTKDAYEICNMAQTAKMIFDAACARKESIGAHYIVD